MQKCSKRLFDFGCPRKYCCTELSKIYYRSRRVVHRSLYCNGKKKERGASRSILPFFHIVYAADQFADLKGVLRNL